jgi:hypothetical protein
MNHIESPNQGLESDCRRRGSKHVIKGSLIRGVLRQHINNVRKDNIIIKLLTKGRKTIGNVLNPRHNRTHILTGLKLEVIQLLKQLDGIDLGGHMVSILKGFQCINKIGTSPNPRVVLLFRTRQKQIFSKGPLIHLRCIGEHLIPTVCFNNIREPRQPFIPTILRIQSEG